MTIFSCEQFVAARGIFTTCRRWSSLRLAKYQMHVMPAEGDDCRWSMRPQTFNEPETAMKENSPFEVMA
ncbi:MAG: hypothetical protein KJ587_03765 [Alphaproteobacteria bacterium]|nr:hypothetical protein [Alphaproteobacteria bacterium]